MSGLQKPDGLPAAAPAGSAAAGKQLDTLPISKTWFSSQLPSSPVVAASRPGSPAVAGPRTKNPVGPRRGYIPSRGIPRWSDPVQKKTFSPVVAGPRTNKILQSRGCRIPYKNITLKYRGDLIPRDAVPESKTDPGKALFKPSPLPLCPFLLPLRVVSSVQQMSVPLQHVGCSSCSFSDIVASHSLDFFFLFFRAFPGINPADRGIAVTQPQQSGG